MISVQSKIKTRNFDYVAIFNAQIHVRNVILRINLNECRGKTFKIYDFGDTFENKIIKFGMAATFNTNVPK